MADTRVQLEVEDWVRDNWMPQQYGIAFHRNRLALTSGGVFDFDAVSEDRTIAACISTSRGKTASGKNGVGKLFKLRSDMFFLLLAKEPRRRLLILTEDDMHATCLKERAGGRCPPEIEFMHVKLPGDLISRLHEARLKASREVTPVSPAYPHLTKL